jgi:chemotaxis protein methyltransferase CheR
MLLREYFPTLASATRIIASDISRDMLARTREATYSHFEVRRGLPAPMLAKYLVPDGAQWRVRPELRAMVETREINLAVSFPALPAIDILLVRNVLIYFDAATKQDIMIRMRKVLAQDGVLMLGGAETALGVDAGFDRCTADNKAAWYGPR